MTFTHRRMSATPANDLPAKLEQVVTAALDQAAAILAIDLDRDHPQYATELRAKASVVNTALATQVKVDETNLKRQISEQSIRDMVKEAHALRARDPRVVGSG